MLSKNPADYQTEATKHFITKPQWAILTHQCYQEGMGGGFTARPFN